VASQAPEYTMSKSTKASYKSKGGNKDSATKNTFNPPAKGGPAPDVESKGPQEQDPKRRIGQFGGAGEPPIMKK
jgi:hypothetical protein